MARYGGLWRGINLYINNIIGKIIGHLIREKCLIFSSNNVRRSNYAAAEQKSSGKFDEIKEKILKELDEIVQSSSIVECINSIVRPYINNTKAQINQELLNLIMFYHNHRRYKAGKREGKTPYEILTGKTQTKYWLDLLMEIYEEQQTLK